MDISGIILIEDANTSHIHLYKEGSFWKAYERSAYLFVKYIRAYQTKLRYYKNINREIISIGFPDVALAGIMEKAKVALQSEVQVSLELKNEIVLDDFVAWKSQTPLTEIPKLKNKPKEQTGSVLEAIRSFSLANATPLQCMQLIAELQKDLSSDRSPQGEGLEER